MPTDRPAIILITADQLRKDALGCYGGEAVETPNLDRLAEQSVRFDRAYTNSPWCLPSRCAILTGRFPHHNGAYSNFRDGRLDPVIPNLYTTLRDHGYDTAHIGKCHYAPVPYGETRPDRTLPYDAFRRYYESLGMDHLILQDDKQVSAWFYDDYSKELDAAGYLDSYRRSVWDQKRRKVFAFPGPAEWHPDAWVGRRASQFIDSEPGTDPLFLWVSFSGPHFPFDPPEAYLSRVPEEGVGRGHAMDGEFDDPGRIHHRSFHGGKGRKIEGAGSAPDGACKNYSDAYWAQLRRSYFANVALLDEQVGHVMRALERRFGDDILVIFTADHGEMLGNHGLWGKHNCAYEDVLNVPLLVRFPGRGDGTRTDAQAMLVDILPTCLQAAGANLPPDLDGHALDTHLESGGYRFVVSEGGGFLSVSDGRHKYVRVQNHDRTYEELFDLDEDPHEFHNVVGKEPYREIKAVLQQALVEHFMSSVLA